MDAPASAPPPHWLTRHTYDGLSGWYDLLAGSEQRLVRLGVEQLAVQAGEWVLEIGAGTGHALLALSRAVGPEGQVVGLDLSPGMLGRARRRLARGGGALRTSLVCGDGVRLAVGASRFDAIFMSFTLELFAPAEMSLVLAECWRVLRPQGRLCVVSLSRRGGVRWMLGLYEWAHARLPTWVDCRPIDPARALLAGGFGVASTVERSLWGLPVEIVVGLKTSSP
jgi:demethylmenaquinone methyltransferase/2-methoxy-6-polyprenyl-1,4-benzoquinol methylase